MALMVAKGTLASLRARLAAHDASGAPDDLASAMLTTLTVAAEALAEAAHAPAEATVYVARDYPPSSIEDALTRVVTLVHAGQQHTAVVSPTYPLDRPDGYEAMSLMVNLRAP